MRLNKAAILIKKAALEFDKMANNALKQEDLTAPQYKVMKYLFSEKKARIVDLERYYSMSHPTAIGIAQNLEKKGLIEYRKNPDDARSRFLVPTEAAWKRQQRMDEIGDRLNKELTRKLTDQEQQQLVALLKKMLGIRS